APRRDLCGRAAAQATGRPRSSPRLRTAVRPHQPTRERNSDSSSFSVNCRFTIDRTQASPGNEPASPAPLPAIPGVRTTMKATAECPELTEWVKSLNCARGSAAASKPSNGHSSVQVLQLIKTFFFGFTLDASSVAVDGSQYPVRAGGGCQVLE